MINTFKLHKTMETMDRIKLIGGNNYLLFKQISASDLASNGIEVLPRTDNPMGKTYEEWLELWCRWFLSNDRDSQNEDLSKGYVMLRGQMRDSYGIPSEIPLVLPLDITADTILCFTLLCSLSSKAWEPRRRDLETDQQLAEDAKLHQEMPRIISPLITIDGINIADFVRIEERNITTTPFQIVVQPGEWDDYEGPQIKRSDIFPYRPGDARVVSNGLLFLCKLKKRTKKYILRIKAEGVRDYKVDATYTIQVN
jgi:hypothetical protein